VLDAALHHEVERVLFPGSSCVYPELAPQRIVEDSLLTEHLDRTNDACAIAKIAGIVQLRAVRRQCCLPCISAMTNLDGPNDNLSPTGSHVLPALIRCTTRLPARVRPMSPTGEPAHREGLERRWRGIRSTSAVCAARVTTTAYSSPVTEELSFDAASRVA
jgi:nucleoside-diphosphate-sugar epimerase